MLTCLKLCTFSSLSESMVGQKYLFLYITQLCHIEVLGITDHTTVCKPYNYKTPLVLSSFSEMCPTTPCPLFLGKNSVHIQIF